MLEDIRRIFRKSLHAFRAEINAREPEDQVAEMLAAMRREMVAVKAEISELEEVNLRARAELERERVALTECERRGAMAERIADAETAQIARDFAVRHREKITILEQKTNASGAEIVLRRRESEEMQLKYREADANRFLLLAQLRKAAASAGGATRSPLSDQDGTFADLSRMEEKMGRDTDYLDALRELDDTPPPPARPGAEEMEERLRELKRRMGKDS